MAAPELRRTGRVILMDPMYRVLLLRFQLTQAGEPFAFWATPGGRAEDHESDLEAAIRELDEELRLSVPLEGPVHVHESTFEVNGNHWRGRDVFFHGRCASNDPVFTGGTEPDERDALQEMRWWTLEDLEKTAETVFPPDLATVSRRLVT